MTSPKFDTLSGSRFIIMMPYYQYQNSHSNETHGRLSCIIRFKRTRKLVFVVT